MKKLTTTALLVAFCLHANAADLPNDIKHEIIDRCKTQMSQYGAAMVKACVDQDIEAYNALQSYPEAHSAAVDRCMTQMRKYGFSMVKACLDQDIEAEKALSEY